MPKATISTPAMCPRPGRRRRPPDLLPASEKLVGRALNDGQRWLLRRSEAALGEIRTSAPKAQSQSAAFLLSQFGLQTMADYGSFLADQELEEVSEQQDSALLSGLEEWRRGSGRLRLA